MSIFTVTKTPNTGANHVLGGRAAWSNPTFFLTGGISQATVNLAGVGDSDELWGTNFGFAIPTTAQIVGIFMEWLRRSPNANGVTDADVKMLKASVAVGGNLAVSGAWINAPTWQGYTADPTLFTAADINDLNFGGYMHVVGQQLFNRNAQITGQRITVTYSMDDNVISAAVMDD